MDFSDHGAFLLALRAKDAVWVIDPDYELVRGNHFHIQAVDVRKLAGLGSGSAGHSAELRIQRGKLLQGNLPEDPALALLRDALLDFDGGMETRGPTAIQRDPAFELVLHLDHAVLHDVI